MIVHAHWTPWVLLIGALVLPVPGASSELPEPITNSIGMKLLPVAPGTFTMGSPDTEKGHKPEEIRREVTIENGFYIGVFEVTQAEYQRVTGENPSKTKSPNLPVDHVSWFDAVAFCKKLSELEPNMHYRLPSEAEWEYACRAGTSTRYYWGEDPSATVIGEYAFYSANSDGKTHEVGQKRANPWGLYDMNGNVWEWCEDWMAPYDVEQTINPSGPQRGEGRICRGGCWAYDENRCRSAERNEAPPDSVHVNLGIRVVAERSQAR